MALADLPRLRIFRVGGLLLLAGILLMRSLVWRYDISGAARDGLLVLPPLLWAPWVARLYRRRLLQRLREGRTLPAGHPVL